MAATPEQILQAVQELSAQIVNAISSAKLSPKQVTIVNGLSDIDNSLGTVRAGELLALSDGEDPQDADGTGTFISALGRVFGSKTFHIGGVKDGDLKWGANALTGELEAGDSAVLLTSNGVSVFNGATEVARLGNLNGFLGYSSDVYGFAFGDAAHYMVYTQTEGVQVYGALVDERENLNADRDYYVRSDGNDSNSGLVDSAGGAFLTLQKAIDEASGTLDTRGYNVIIHVADGTYATTSGITNKAVLGNGTVTIRGNTTTPDNVIITTSADNAKTFNSYYIPTVYKIEGFKPSATGSGTGETFVQATASTVEIKSVNISTGFDYHLAANLGGTVRITGSYTISSGASHALSAQSGGIIVYNGSVVTTLVGTPAFTSFAFAYAMGFIYMGASNSFSGSSTGSRFNSTFNAVIDSAGVGVNAFPGDSAGTEADGGQYN